VALDIAAEGDVDSARQCLMEIAQDWGDLDRLVEGVLTVARFDLARDAAQPVVTLQYEPLDVRTLVERAAVGFSALHPRHILTVEEGDQPILLVGDGSMLRRAVDNLLNNAAQYSEPGTTIRLYARRRGDEVLLSVTDQGMGIDAADLPRLFEPLFRTDRSRARKTGGVGLGLAVAKRIVEAHQGRILVESRVGVGTTVAFTVPAEPGLL
jgi:signal transduction histidine kinase